MQKSTRREHLKRLGFGGAGWAELSWASGGARESEGAGLKMSDAQGIKATRNMLI